MKGLLTAFATNRVFANIVLLLLFLAGGLAVVSMIRETFPEFSLDMITVTVDYPGADPEEVEEGISRKIEEAVEGIEGIKQYTTESGENRGMTIVEVKEDYDVDEVLERVRTKVAAISTFPPDAENPVVSELLLRDVVVLLYLSGDMPERRIKEWAEGIKDELQMLPEVSQVDIFGARDYEISIEVSEERLREYGLTFSEVSEAVRRSSLNMAGGTIRTRGEEIRVRTMGRKYTGKELSQIVVLARPEGEIITLDRIARIRDGFEEDPISATINGEPSLMVIVNKTREEDSLAISESVQRYVREKQQTVPEGASLQILFDNTDMLRARINLLLRNGTIGMGIVFLLLWMFLSVRLSFWAGMGIPVSITGALAILWWIGATINMISLFGLIMVLGIIVDDAIVVGEAIYVHRMRGKPALQAAVDGVCEVGLPVIAAVVTTIVAFIPLLYVGGIMGKFIAIMPVAVISCLVVSLLECLFLLPAHLSHLPGPEENSMGENNTGRQSVIRWLEAVSRVAGSTMEWFVEHIYKSFLSRVLYWRYISFCIGIAVMMLTIGVMRGGLLKFEVFPEIDGFVITATVEMPEGTPPAVTKKAMDQIESALIRLGERTPTRSGEPMIRDRLALLGQTLGDIPVSGPNVGAVQGILIDSQRRGVHTKDLMVEWEKEIGPILGVEALTFTGLSAGPPGAPIEVWLQGHRMEDILAASHDLMERLGKFDGVYQIRSDFSAGKKELRLSLKPEARTLGLTVDDLARQIFAGYFGQESVRLQRGRDDIRVRVRYTRDERSRISDLARVRIRTANGREVPLTSVADFSFETGYATITRTDGMRRVAVSAGVDTNRANANEIFAELASGFFSGLEEKYPGVRVALQGEKKKMRESFDSLRVGYPLAVMGIYIIIATMFRSYVQPLVIMVTLPFGIVGAVMGHLLLGYDLSIMSIFGMVALTGVVVNDAIVLIERINENIAGGDGFFEAVINGGARRFRAIFLTTLSTVGGLTPLILETDLQAKFLIPMALSIAAGVAFATVLTLVLVPSLLAILSDLRLLTHRVMHGAWPRRLDVEPAASRYKEGPKEVSDMTGGQI